MATSATKAPTSKQLRNGNKLFSTSSQRRRQQKPQAIAQRKYTVFSLIAPSATKENNASL